MERLHFGAKAARRARLKRLLLWAWIVSIPAGIVGVPGTDIGFRLFERALAPGAAADSGRADVNLESAFSGPSRHSVRVKRVSGPLAEAEPTASPSPTTPVYGGTVTDIILTAAAEFGVDGDWMISIAECESTLDPSAVSASGTYHGLFQYDHSTWAAYGQGDIYDPVAQARTTAYLLSQGQSSRWPNCA